MFDNLTPPANLPTGKEPEDMFDKVAPVPAPAPGLQPPSPTPLLSQAPEPSREIAAEVKPPLVSSRKVIVAGGVVLGILVIAGVGFAAFRFVRNAATPARVTETPEFAPVAVETPPPQIPELPAPLPLSDEGAPAQESVAPIAPVDTDGDGLTDEEEAGIGTIKENPDSDNDELLDGEETKTYQTDPLNPDTDGDTYLDGQEVKGGYNPKGAGKLFTVPAAQ